MQISFPSKFVLSFSTGFHLNLPLDEFGAFYIDYLQNLADKFFLTLFFHFSSYGAMADAFFPFDLNV